MSTAPGSRDIDPPTAAAGVRGAQRVRAAASSGCWPGSFATCWPLVPVIELTAGRRDGRRTRRALGSLDRCSAGTNRASARAALMAGREDRTTTPPVMAVSRLGAEATRA